MPEDFTQFRQVVEKADTLKNEFCQQLFVFLLTWVKHGLTWVGELSAAKCF
jgi:hypothetical protein